MAKVLLVWLTTVFACGVYQYVIVKKGEVRVFQNVHYIWTTLLIFYALLVLSVTGSVTAEEAVKGITQFPAYSEITWIPFESGITIPTVLNLVMFLPLGFLLPAAWVRFRSMKAVTGAGFLCSAVLEAGQLLNFRATDMEDLLMNTLGAGIGFGLWVVSMKCLGRKIRWTQVREGSFLARHELEGLLGITFFIYFFLA